MTLSCTTGASQPTLLLSDIVAEEHVQMHQENRGARLQAGALLAMLLLALVLAGTITLGQMSLSVTV